MSIALQWGNVPVKGKYPDSAGFIYLDAVTAYTTSQSGKVTSHPISTGGKIADHFVKDNKLISISAVISGVDISQGKLQIRDVDGQDSPSNAYSTEIPAVSINNTDNIFDFLPDSIGQFFSPSTPQINLLEFDDTNSYERVKKTLDKLFEEGKIQLVTLIEYEGSIISSLIENVVLTSLITKEDPELGEGLHLEMNLEQVTFVTSKTAKISDEVREDFQRQMALQRGIGGSDSEEISDPTPPESKVTLNCLLRGGQYPCKKYDGTMATNQPDAENSYRTWPKK